MRIGKIRNGGGGDKAPQAPAPAAPAPAPVEDKGPDPAMQAEIERQRALRFKAGAEGTTGSDTTVTGTTEDNAQSKTLLGE